MSRVLRLAALLLGLAVRVAAQESVVTGLSTDNIALTADFNGSELFVFGAIRRDGPVPAESGPLDIVITVKGPKRAVTVRHKQRRFGILGQHRYRRRCGRRRASTPSPPPGRSTTS